MTDHGQTYGEAVEEVLNEVDEAVEDLRDDAEELRENGDWVEAAIVEVMALSLTGDAAELEEKVGKMPFGLDSAQGYGEVIGSPAVTLAEEKQRDDG